ncbi:MAG TPA: hypothetical protein VI653_14500 [Steroidobacteraceae bacterium]
MWYMRQYVPLKIPPEASRETVQPSPDLIALLRSAGDPLHLLAADTLVSLQAMAERLQERVYQLEAIARLNGETIRGMQQAAAEIARAEWARR